MFNMVRRLLGLHDKEQEQRTRRISTYVHLKQNKFSAEMLRVQLQAKKIHEVAEAKAQESSRLVQVVDDIAAKVAIVTGGVSVKERSERYAN